jgi:hypothetical protein
MYATLRSALNGELIEYPIEFDTVAEMHEYAQRSCRSGLLAAITVWQMFTGHDPADALKAAYLPPDGQYIPYTLEFPGDQEDEEGITDISPAAMGKYFLSTIENSPYLERVMKRHVQGNCTANPCKVEQLFRALELDHLLRPPADPGE